MPVPKGFSWVFHELSHNSHVQQVLRLPFSRSRPHAAEPSTFHRWERQAAPLKMSVVNIGIRDPMCHWLDVGGNLGNWCGKARCLHVSVLHHTNLVFQFSFPSTCFRWFRSTCSIDSRNVLWYFCWATDGRAVLWLVFDAQRLASGWSICTCTPTSGSDQNLIVI